ncbi:MAG: hypothetical protein KBS70_07370 [Bacteroidales bacterium]|nr:hypothetical protein [Candidatus Colicola equi]
MALNIGQATPVSRQNSIMAELVEPLALQAIYSVPSTNPLFEVFERESVDAGAEVEEILLGDANIETYDAEGKTTLKPRDVKAIARYYNDYEHPVYTTTVYRNEIRKVALNPENATSLAATIVAQLTATRDDDLYAKEKKVLKDMSTNYAGLKAGTITAGTKAAMGEQLTEMIRNTIDAFTFKNDQYLLHNVNHPENKIKGKAYFDRIRIIIPYKVKNAIDVGYLANVYNLEKTDLLSKMVTIDTDDGIVYVIDKMSVFRYPQTDELLGQDNGEGAFRNEFLHVNQMIGASTLFKFAFIDASNVVA